MYMYYLVTNIVLFFVCFTSISFFIAAILDLEQVKYIYKILLYFYVHIFFESELT